MLACFALKQALLLTSFATQLCAIISAVYLSPLDSLIRTILDKVHRLLGINLLFWLPKERKKPIDRWLRGRVAVIEIERAALPATTVFRAFTPNHLPGQSDQIEAGTSLLLLGFAREHKVVVISYLTRDILSSPGHYSRPACIGTNFSGVLS